MMDVSSGIDNGHYKVIATTKHILLVVSLCRCVK